MTSSSKERNYVTCKSLLRALGTAVRPMTWEGLRATEKTIRYSNSSSPATATWNYARSLLSKSISALACVKGRCSDPAPKQYLGSYAYRALKVLTQTIRSLRSELTRISRELGKAGRAEFSESEFDQSYENVAELREMKANL